MNGNRPAGGASNPEHPWPAAGTAARCGIIAPSVTQNLAFSQLDPASEHRRDDARSRRTFAAALALSLLLHGALVWQVRVKMTPAAPEADPSPAALAPLTAALAPARPQPESAPTPPP